MVNVNELIRNLDRSDPRLVESLMLAYYDFVYHLAVSFLGDPDEAADAVQETFLQAAGHIEQYHPGTSLKSWLAKIALNACRGRYRKLKARRRLQAILALFSPEAQPAIPTPEEAVLANEKQRLLKKAVDSLDSKHRVPVLLRYGHGMTVPEIADALGLNEGTVYSRLHYAHKALRERLGPAFDGAAAGEESE